MMMRLAGLESEPCVSFCVESCLERSVPFVCGEGAVMLLIYHLSHLLLWGRLGLAGLSWAGLGAMNELNLPVSSRDPSRLLMVDYWLVG